MAWVGLDSLASETDTTWTDSTLLPETDYEYRVTVVNAAGFEQPSTPRSVSGYSILPVRLLAAAPDPVDGTFTLTWNRYTDPGFASYQVFRRVSGLADEALIATADSVSDTTLVDGSPEHRVGYVYRVATLTSTDTLRSNELERTLILPSVQLTSTTFEAATGSATLRWIPYSGPRFQAYRIWRQEPALAPVVVGELADLAQSTFVDTGLTGGIEYSYRVDLVSNAAETVVGNERVGQLHAVLDEFPLSLNEGDHARVYAFGDTIITLLASDTSTVIERRRTDGRLRSDPIRLAVVDQDPTRVSLALGEDETSYLTGQSLARIPLVDIPGPLRIYSLHADTAQYRLHAQATLPGASHRFAETTILGQSLDIDNTGLSAFVHAPYPVWTAVHDQGQVAFESTSPASPASNWLVSYLDRQIAVTSAFTRRTQRFSISTPDVGDAETVQVFFGLRHALNKLVLTNADDQRRVHNN